MSAPILFIGHVDHGKTALVRALTGTETDRLPEEKARGLSITPGFARLVRDGQGADIIDIPGHEEFMSAMIRGAAGAASAVLVVSAPDGAGAQTFEHSAIARTLGLHPLCIVLTKADRLLAAEREGAQARIAEALQRTCFGASKHLFCSTRTGEGLGELAALLLSDTARRARTDAPADAFLPIDRVFSQDGHGKIVTGTLLGGRIRLEDPLVLSPGNRPVRARRIETGGLRVSEAARDQRTAVNLAGPGADNILRGDVLHTPGAFTASSQMDVRLEMMPEAARPLCHDDSVRILLGTGEASARIRLYAPGNLSAGETGLARLTLSQPLVAHAFQRAIIRWPSPAASLAGAVILDPAAPPLKGPKARRAEVLVALEQRSLSQLTEALAACSGGSAPVSELSRLTGESPERLRERLGEDSFITATGAVIPRARLASARILYLEALAQAHLQTPLRALVSRPRLTGLSATLVSHAEDMLAEEGAIRRTGNGVAAGSHDPRCALTPARTARMEALLTQLRTAGLSPPARKALMDQPEDEDLLALLVMDGRITQLFNVSLGQALCFDTAAIEMAAARLRAAWGTGEAFTSGEARALLATSRRHIIPLLEYFDEIGLTARTGDVRRVIPG